MVRVVILSDNKVIALRPQGLKAEWGFSALVDDVLFDTGQTGVAFDNLLLLNLPMPKKIVLSHGHYDHTGGLLHFLREGVEIYAHPDAFLPRFYKGEYIGIPFRKERLEDKAKIVEHTEPLEIKKGVWALGEVPREFETALLKDSFVIREGVKERDEIRDDQSLAVKTENGVLLVLGCCHSGLRNTVKWAEEVVGDEVRFVVGGTHLISFKPEEIREIVRKLDLELIAPCHCTGLKAEFVLKEIFGERFKMVGSGSVLDV